MFHLIDLFKNRVRKINPLIFPFFLVAILFIVLPTLIIVFYAFFNSSSKTLIQHTQTLDRGLWGMLFRSLYIALVTVFLCLIFGYPVSYFIFRARSNIIKTILILLITMPLWSNYFIKLVGLKCIFDYWNGYQNSTHGISYTIIGLTYIFMPATCVTIYNTLNNIPQSIILSSRDLGCNECESIFLIIIPYTKVSIYAAITLVFFPSLFSVAASEFLNNQNDSKMIGEYLHSSMTTAFGSTGEKTKISFLVLLTASLSFALYAICKFIPKVFLKTSVFVSSRTLAMK